MAGCGSGFLALPPHHPVKYGSDQPDVPPDDAVGAGAFHRSFDDRLWLFSRAWEPSDPSTAWATLMIVHGTLDHSGVYAELGERLAAQGVAVFASDMRGWGRSDGEPLYFNNIETFTKDVLADYERIHGPESPYARVASRFLLGKSLGGLVTAWAANQHRSHWAGLIGLSGAYKVEAARLPRRPLAACIRVAALALPKLPAAGPLDPELLVSDAAARQAWEQDPLVSHGKLTLGYVVEIMRAQAELQASLQGLGIPVLMLWGTGDQVVTEEGHRMVVEASGHADSRLIQYPGGLHNLLAEPALKSTLMSDIASWIADISRRGPAEETGEEVEEAVGN